ncbi:MAG TPA: hypothetical protein GXX75_14630 [Clostridiales bacterium]|nr:hypothetical protein [Clostridiales bacterium]
MEHMKFCDCLKLLLSTLDISSNRLSKVINVDSSLVNRWINGKRIPPYNTYYIDHISEFLAKNIYNTYQMHQVQEILQRICGAHSVKSSLQEQIKKLLSESQGYSIECHKKEKSENKNKVITNQMDKKHAAAISDITKYGVNSFSFSSDDKILVGIESITYISQSILESASVTKPGKDPAIYIAYNNYHDMEFYSEKTLNTWIKTLDKALANGWHLVLLMRLAPDIPRMVKCIGCLINLIHKKQISLYYIKNYDSYIIGGELLIVPDIGSLIYFNDQPGLHTKSAFYLSSTLATDIYLSHLKMLMEKSCHPLFKKHQGDLNYMDLLIKAEESAGNRILYRYSFGAMTIPKDLYFKLLKKNNISGPEVKLLAELYDKRHKAFIYNAQRYQCWDIYASCCVKDLIREQQIYLYSYNGIHLIDVERKDIIQHMEYIIFLLETYHNYNIAFQKIDASMEKGIKNIYCLVKERHSVLLEVIDSRKSSSEVRITADEPTLVNGSYEYLKNILKHIPFIYKSKSDIIDWLKSEIKILQDNE